MAVPPPPPGFRPVQSGNVPAPPPGFRPVESNRIGVPRNPRREDLSARVLSYYGGKPNPTSDDAINALIRARQAGDADAERVISGTLQDVQAVELDPTRDMGTGSRVAAGAGSALTDLALGARQVIGAAKPSEVEAKRAIDAPLMNTAGGFLGRLGGETAIAAIPVPGSSTVRALGPGAMALEAGARNVALAGLQPVGEGESRGLNMSVAGGLSAVGSAGGAGVRRILGGTADPKLRRSLEFARDQNIPVYASQASTSGPLRALSAAVNQTFPGTGARGAVDAQQSAFNRALARSFGIDSDDLTGEAIAAARQRFDQQYAQAFGGAPIAFDTRAASSINSILAEARRRLSKEQFEAVQREANNIFDNFAGGTVDPSIYQSVRGELYDAATGEGGRAASYIRRLRSALDETASRSLPNDEARNLYRRTNQEYGNFKVVEQALRRVAGAEDNVSPASLWAIINQKGVRASPEMREFARLGQQVLKQQIPTSGSVERGAMTGAVISAGQSLAGGGGLAIDPVTAGAVLGTGAALGRGLNSARLGRMAGLGVSPNTPQFNRFMELMAPYLTTQTGEAAFSDDYYMPPRG